MWHWVEGGGAAVCRIPVSNLLWRSVYFTPRPLARRMTCRVEFGTRSLVIANLGRKRMRRGICPFTGIEANFQFPGRWGRGLCLSS